jgi:thiol-disulfide isomerase/thioredoxin
MLSKNFFALVSLLVVAALTLSAARLPRPMSDAVMETLTIQKRFHLIDTRGKIRVVLLVSVGCQHCEKMIPVFNKVEREYRNKGVQFLGATVNVASVQEISPFLAKTKPGFLIGSLQQDQVMELADFTQEERPFVPMVLFVDKNNYVRYQYNGNSDFFKDPARSNAVLKAKGRSDEEQTEMRLRAVLEAMLKQK